MLHLSFRPPRFAGRRAHPLARLWAVLCVAGALLLGACTPATEGEGSAASGGGDAVANATGANGEEGQTASLPPVPVSLGPWRATVRLPGGELPFTLRLAESADGVTAVVENATEQVSVGAVVRDGAKLAFVFPAFNTRIDANLRDDGSMAGTLTLVKRGGVEQVMPFEAFAGVTHRFRVNAPPRVDVSGRWAVTFTDDEGENQPAVGEFRQDGGVLSGTFLTPTGDYRYLAGNVEGESVLLSTFDGAHAFLFRARVEDDGTMVGDFWSGTAWHERWRARRDEQAALPDAGNLTFLKPGYDEFTFEFPDENGMPVALSDPRFAGKVVLVALAGSWCPNCHDEAAYLAQYYREHRDLGIEVVCLMYEHFEDFDKSAAQVQLFREKFDIEYTTLIAGSSDKVEAAKTLPMLNHVLAFPTTIFVDRQGNVRRIHTGFSGPGTGAYFEAWEREFRAFMETLVNEPA